MACTRMAARATRSLTTVSPQSASWCPVAWTTWSGTSRSTAMPPPAASAANLLAYLQVNGEDRGFGES